MTARAMTANDSHSPDAPLPMPKINVPPSLEVVHDEGQGQLDAPVGRATPMSAAPPGIRWDAPFALSLIALLVMVNITLALLFARPAPSKTDFVTALAAPAAPTVPLPATASAAPALSTLAPAGGVTHERRATTTYISREERKVLLDQLQRTRQPGVVSLPPARNVVPDSQ